MCIALRRSKVVAVIIPEGAHHLDLMFSNADDPPSVVHARQVATAAVAAYISAATNQPSVHDNMQRQPAAVCGITSSTLTGGNRARHAVDPRKGEDAAAIACAPVRATSGHGGRTEGAVIPLVEVVGSPALDQASSRPRVKGRLRFAEHLGTGPASRFRRWHGLPDASRGCTKRAPLQGPAWAKAPAGWRTITVARCPSSRGNRAVSLSAAISALEPPEHGGPSQHAPGLLMALPPPLLPSLSLSLSWRRPRAARRALLIPRHRAPCSGAFWHLRGSAAASCRTFERS